MRRVKRELAISPFPSVLRRTYRTATRMAFEVDVTRRQRARRCWEGRTVTFPVNLAMSGMFVHIGGIDAVKSKGLRHHMVALTGCQDACASATETQTMQTEAVVRRHLNTNGVRIELGRRSTLCPWMWCRWCVMPLYRTRGCAGANPPARAG